jgi:NAD(P)-dependent dehydrogenase (short-subunit alcohol dehydrogenase family)
MNALQKVAIVTGASRGLGAELVRAFRGIGYAVVANARSAIERFGRIDTLVNNAGVFISKPSTDYTEADFLAIASVNLSGFFHMTQKAAARMLQAGAGHIVTITAALAEQPMTVLPAALASLTKGGLNAVTRALAIEYAGRGVRVNAVAPGVIDTPMHRPDMRGFLDSLQPMGRMGQAGEIADAVLYLERAAFVTGEILHVDGGAHAGRW